MCTILPLEDEEGARPLIRRVIEVVVEEKEVVVEKEGEEEVEEIEGLLGL